MKTNCLDIGVIQSFLDGELLGSEITRVSDHIADCDACAMLVSRAEDENAIVFPALAREFDAMVPTQRLWARIEGSIETQKASAPWWRKLRGIIVSDLLSPQIGAFAALLIIMGLFAIYKLSGPAPAVTNDVASAPKITTAPVTREIVPVPLETKDVTQPIVTPSRTSGATYETASYRAPRHTMTVQAAVNSTSAQPTTAADVSYLPGEASYVKTIASLDKSVTADQDPNVMSASQQVSFAHDMAVVDNTIKRMRDAVKKNPKDETAKQMLSSAYQNKIDLLNSIAQKQELVASLR
jgi:ribosomal protein S15P/S13E